MAILKKQAQYRSKVKFSKENSPRPKFKLYYNKLQKEQEVGNDFTIYLLNLIPKVTTRARSCESGDINFLNCLVTSHWTRNQRVICFKDGCLSVRQQLRQFGFYGSFAGGEIMYLICHETSQDHLIEGSCKLMGGQFLCIITTLTSMVTKEIVIVEICF